MEVVIHFPNRIAAILAERAQSEGQSLEDYCHDLVVAGALWDAVTGEEPTLPKEMTY